MDKVLVRERVGEGGIQITVKGRRDLPSLTFSIHKEGLRLKLFILSREICREI